MMHTAVRPYATVGVALVGASVIAVAPVAAPLPDVHIPSLRVPVELTQMVNPIQTWVEVITTAIANATLLGQAALTPPAPILMQIITNQISYAKALGGGVSDALTYIRTVTLNPSNDFSIFAQVQNAITEIRGGNIAGGVQDLYLAFVTQLIVPALDITGPLQTVITQIFTNALNVANLTSEVIALPFLSLLEVGLSYAGGFGAAAQAVFDNAVAGNLAGTITALLNGPGVITGALLNGFNGSPGILSPPGSLGLIAALLTVREAIAEALGATPPMVASAKATAPTAPTALPNLAANTVTVTTAPTKQLASTVEASAPAGSTATTTGPSVGSGPLTKALTPLNTTATDMSHGNMVAPGQVPTTPTAHASTVLTNVLKQAPTQASGGLTNAIQHVGSAGPKHH